MKFVVDKQQILNRPGKPGRLEGEEIHRADLSAVVVFLRVWWLVFWQKGGGCLAAKAAAGRDRKTRKSRKMGDQTKAES